MGFKNLFQALLARYPELCRKQIATEDPRAVCVDIAPMIAAAMTYERDATVMREVSRLYDAIRRKFDPWIAAMHKKQGTYYLALVYDGGAPLEKAVTQTARKGDRKAAHPFPEGTIFTGTELIQTADCFHDRAGRAAVLRYIASQIRQDNWPINLEIYLQFGTNLSYRFRAGRATELQAHVFPESELSLYYWADYFTSLIGAVLNPHVALVTRDSDLLVIGFPAHCNPPPGGRSTEVYWYYNNYIVGTPDETKDKEERSLIFHLHGLYENLLAEGIGPLMFFNYAVCIGDSDYHDKTALTNLNGNDEVWGGVTRQIAKCDGDESLISTVREIKRGGKRTSRRAEGDVVPLHVFDHIVHFLLPYWFQYNLTGYGQYEGQEPYALPSYDAALPHYNVPEVMETRTLENFGFCRFKTNQRIWVEPRKEKERDSQ